MIMTPTYNPALRRLRQEEFKFKDNLGYLISKNKNKPVRNNKDMKETGTGKIWKRIKR